ncbi:MULTISPECIES: amidohydrolase family protein [Mycolicibacter]|uniref:Cytosine deaminase n=1 Tax=Mycolicibacter virginiensis TaxID=1795032 RepID=A0A9X7NZS6_9MYCO|nr:MULTISPECIES: amidohydrolase family protein [Mycobacteriaceae]OBG40904.1 cytosine deaminase [Mycolicibacter heraklionensis]OBJ30831.1 cytosine deaminase [Mycolicibacter heraklionensis]PQM53365.1 cytosine deaminase [Mycolicibacter virginiensis]ULP48817.1 amidohydrolase family protein [Mycolicibacter virginiensis]
MTAPSGSGPERLVDALLPDGRRVDVTLRGGRIAAIDPHQSESPVPGENALDCGGALLLPAFVDGHCHLDKTFLGAPWQPHRPAGSLRERIGREKALRSQIVVPATERATALANRMVSLGTGHVRSHVDIDLEAGLTGLHALLEVRATLRDRISIQLVAFPQSGVVTAPGVAALLDAALAEGAEVIGGLDPAGFDGDVDGQLDVVFGLADRHGAGIDIHLHDPGTLGTGQLRAIAERTRALGLGGKVTVSHAYALGQVDGDEVDRTATALAAAGVAILTNGPAGTMPPVLRLRDHGVRVFAGSDNIRDAWWPYGTGDMLERATIIGLEGSLMTDDELGYAASLITDSAAAVLGLDGYGLQPGCRADLVVVEAAGVAEAVAAHPERRWVLHDGRVVAGTCA